MTNAIAASSTLLLPIISGSVSARPPGLAGQLVDDGAGHLGEEQLERRGQVHDLITAGAVPVWKLSSTLEEYFQALDPDVRGSRSSPGRGA